MVHIAKTFPVPETSPVRRALVSVSDKTGLAEFGSALAELGVDLVSTGGSRQALVQSGLKATEVSALTGFPEMLDGRVKTLHPAVHGGILAVRGDPEHVAALDAHNIGPIDLVVVNLYPFEETVRSGAPASDIVENIDIGGPALIRAAAKNHAYVGVIVDPDDYELVIAALKANNISLPLAMRRDLAAKAFARTAAYDSAIANWFGAQELPAEPRWRSFAGSLRETLRYGENPHQKAAFYVTGEQRP
ncbi:MAG: bifunctional phosphoribosylaminoimidazolecarboxamide formyltransferase/IMP cyclohydrolase, partial [Alphaproteobacteria bacterium]